jgi:hypothetical protein
MTMVRSPIFSEHERAAGQPSEVLAVVVDRNGRTCAERVVRNGRCHADVPRTVRAQIRCEIDVADRTITVLECRPPWRKDFCPESTRFPTCRFRYTKARKEWSLYWCDRNLKFHAYDFVAPTPRLEDLIEQVERDQTGIFWG